MTWVPLKRVAHVWPSNVDKLSVEGEHPVRLVNYTDVYYGDRLHPGLDLMVATATTDEIAKFRLTSGDVILTKDSETADDIGISAYVDEATPDMVCGYHLSLVRPTGAVGRYLHYAIASTHARRQMSVAATGVTRFGLRAESVGSLSVWLPPEEEQRAIAVYLDAETARIDALIIKKMNLVALIEERVWSFRTRALLGRSDGPARSHPVLGEVGEDRTVLSLRRVVPGIGVGLVINPSTYVAAEGVPFIHGSNVRDGWIDRSALKHMSVQHSAQLPASRLSTGDVVVVRAGYPGRAAVIDEDLDGAQCASILILRRSPSVLPDYLAAFFNSGVARSQIAAYQYGAAQEQVNVGHVVDFQFPMADRARQAECVARIRASDSSAQQAIRALERQVGLLTEHRQALITLAVTGELQVP